MVRIVFGIALVSVFSVLNASVAKTQASKHNNQVVVQSPLSGKDQTFLNEINELMQASDFHAVRNQLKVVWDQTRMGRLTNFFDNPALVVEKLVEAHVGKDEKYDHYFSEVVFIVLKEGLVSADDAIKVAKKVIAISLKKAPKFMRCIAGILLLNRYQENQTEIEKCVRFAIDHVKFLKTELEKTKSCLLFTALLHDLIETLDFFGDSDAGYLSWVVEQKNALQIFADTKLKEKCIEDFDAFVFELKGKLQLFEQALAHGSLEEALAQEDVEQYLVNQWKVAITSPEKMFAFLKQQFLEICN